MLVLMLKDYLKSNLFLIVKLLYNNSGNKDLLPDKKEYLLWNKLKHKEIYIIS